MFSLLIFHSALCFYMSGLIGVIQFIHYPSFSFINEEQFIQFQNQHTAVMGGLAGPFMILELLTASLLLIQPTWLPGPMLPISSGVWFVNLIVVIILWLVTFIFSVPLHNKLLQGKDHLHIQKLVRTNWIRTCLWWTRSAGLLILLTR